MSNRKPGVMLSRMLLTATTAHFGQTDKGGNPYILHPLKVMHYLPDDADEELKCIALGHDLLEDTNVTEADLREAFTDRVVEGIKALTKVKGQTPEDYLAGILLNADAMRVKLCDLRHNSDIRRLKNKKVEEKDIQRIAKYMTMYLVIEAELKLRGILVK